MNDPSSTPLLALSLLAFALLLLAVAQSMGRVILLGWRELVVQPLGVKSFLALLLVAAALLLHRPHEDTFIGLDTSGYRHMAGALAQGRPLRSVDGVLADAPQAVRTAFLLSPDMTWRNTRDRSFQLMSIKTCATEPFFYPLLPLAAVGFDRLVPGSARDYLVPLIGWLFVASCLVVGAARGGGWGLALVSALFIGSPLPTWFFRGFFPEAVGAMLVTSVLLRWALDEGRRGASPPSFFALGLALSLHPLLVALVVPTGLLLALTPGARRRDTWAAAAAFAVGLAPLYIMTRWVCQPYGNIFAVRGLLANMRHSGEHCMVMGAALAAGLLLLVAFVGMSGARRDRLLQSAGGLLRRPSLRVILLAMCLVPLLLAATWGPVAGPVRQGAHEFAQAVRPAFGLLLAALLVLSALRSGAPRPWLLTAFAVAAAPAFFYLKGMESSGLWSQRRLLPGYMVLLAAAVAAAPAACAWWRARPRPAAVHALLAAALALAALINIARWPDPYWTRYEAGADAWVARLEATIGAKLAFFDYHPYSFPVAVSGRRRVLGLGEQSGRRMPEVMAWVGERAREEEVLVATAYRNPGLEDGLILRGLGSVSADVARVRSKAALPAVAYRRAVSVEFLAAEPVTTARPARRADKVMDGGPLGMRGPWHREVLNLRDAAGEDVPAMWSRQGAGVIGPWPAPGEWVRISVRGHAGRRDPAEAQQLRVNAPWGAFSAALALSNSYESASVFLPAPAQVSSTGTGLYRLFAENPYDPRSEGIRGYPDDLGALIHEVVVEVVDRPGSSGQP